MDGMMTKLKDVVVGCRSVEKSAMPIRELSDDEADLSDIGGLCSSNINIDVPSSSSVVAASSEKSQDNKAPSGLVTSQEEQQRRRRVRRDDDDDQAGSIITTTTSAAGPQEELQERSILDGAYKTHPLVQATQSALNAVTCLIVVIFAKLWACVEKRVGNWEWVRKVCAETEKVLEIVNYYDDNQGRIVATTRATTRIARSASTTPTNNTRTDKTKMTIPEMPAEVDCLILPPTLPTMRINSISLDDDSSMDAAPVPATGRQYLIRSTSSASSSSDGEDLMYPDSAVYTDGEMSCSGNEDTGRMSSNSSSIGGTSNNAHQLTRRDSDTSDVSSTDGSVEDEAAAKELDTELVSRVVSQVEYMFSDDHLTKDGFLLKHVRRRSDGFVSLKLVAGLRKVKQISREFDVILDALRTSTKLEVNSEGSKVRRVDPLTAHLKSLPVSSQQKEKVSKTCSSSGDEVPSRKTSTASSQGEKENSKRGSGARQQNQKQVTRKDSAGSQKSDGGRQSKGINNRNAQALISNVEREFSFRRRGASLPMPVIAPGILSAQNAFYGTPGSPGVGRFQLQQRQTIAAYLSPNASPPNGLTAAALSGVSGGGARPKSNSYCEGLTTSATMSPWLQRRKAAAVSRTYSDGGIVLSTVIRQPRGPDGTRGFAPSCPRVVEA